MQFRYLIEHPRTPHATRTTAWERSKVRRLRQAVVDLCGDFFQPSEPRHRKAKLLPPSVHNRLVREVLDWIVVRLVAEGTHCWTAKSISLAAVAAGLLHLAHPFVGPLPGGRCESARNRVRADKHQFLRGRTGDGLVAQPDMSMETLGHHQCGFIAARAALY
jgi:hypothetical protein